MSQSLKRNQRSQRSLPSAEQTIDMADIIEQPEENKPEQTKPKQNKQNKQPKQNKLQLTPKSEKQFSPTIITNFLNNYYHNLAAKNHGEQSLNFKVFPQPGDEENKKKINKQAAILNLYDYQGLYDFISTYKAAREQNPDCSIESIIDLTFDMKLRACLDNARVFKTNDKTKLNTFQEFIIPQLGFNSNNVMNIIDYINGVSSYFNNDAKLKTKIYNHVFPHDSHNADKPPTGVNVIYLQHTSKYHDDVLNLVVDNEEHYEDEQSLYRFVLGEIQKHFTDDYKSDDKGVKLQLMNSAIIDNVMNLPMIASEKKGNKGGSIVDPKWINKLKRVELSGTKGKAKLVNLDEELTKDEVIAVKLLVRELLIVKSFIKIILGSKNAREVVKNEAGEDETVKVNVDLKEHLEAYNEVYNKTKQFFNKWNKQIKNELARINKEKERVRKTAQETDENAIEQLVKDTEEEQQYALFLEYFIATVRFIKSQFNYTQPFKTFINDVRKDITFKFNKGLREKLEVLVNQNEEPTDEQIKELANKYFKDWKFINSPKTYDPNDLSIYSKIGKFCGLNIRKEYRVAIGIALVSFIQEQIALIKAFNKRKKEILIYIKI